MRAQSSLRCGDDFNALGLTLKAVIVESITPSESTAEDLRKMGLIDMQTYAQLQAADAMREAATAPGGNLAGAGVGLGAGLGLGQMMTGMMGGMMQPGAQQQQAAPAAAAGAATPEVMNPAQAATYLQVTEADITQMIQSGQIKAKQIGAQYRISKAALDEFLKS